MLRFKKGSKGFTLMELMVVVGILAVLMAIVVPAVTGTKSVSIEGQVKSDGKSVQTATDNFNNKSIKTGQFPEVAMSTGTHAYNDVFNAVAAPTAVVGPPAIPAPTDPCNQTYTGKGWAQLIHTDPTATPDRLATRILVPGSVTATAPNGTCVEKRTVLNFDGRADIYDATGRVKTAFFVPDFLGKDPASIPLMGDEAKNLGDANPYEEFLWLLLVNAPKSDQESRTVQVYRLTVGTCTTSALCSELTYTQIF